MKNIIVICAISLLTSVSCTAQNSDEKSIEETIMAFSKAGDQNDADKLASYLDDNYRIVMNRLFGSEAVLIMPKNVYLQKISSKEFGGEDRKVRIESIVLNGNSAVAKAEFVGPKMTFVSLLMLIKDGKGNWKLISDVPIVK